MPSNNVPLNRFEVCRSRDLEEVRDFLRREFELDPVREVHGRSEVDARINRASLPDLYISYACYGASVSVSQMPSNDTYVLLLPLTGYLEAESGSETLVCHRRQACLMSPDRIWRTRCEARTGRLNLAIRRRALHRRLGALLGEAPTRPLVFRPSLDQGQGPGHTLASFVTWSIEQFDRDDSLLRNELMRNQLEDWILTALLTEHPHSYSEALQPSGGALPRGVKRAIDHIRAHADQPVTIEDLVTVSGVAGRTLYKHFKDFTGCSPMAYLRKVRFERVHADLKRATPADSVTDLAQKWGFLHSGRFSIHYRQIFGETPSETLGKQRIR